MELERQKTAENFLFASFHGGTQIAPSGTLNYMNGGNKIAPYIPPPTPNYAPPSHLPPLESSKDTKHSKRKHKRHSKKHSNDGIADRENILLQKEQEIKKQEAEIQKKKSSLKKLERRLSIASEEQPNFSQSLRHERNTDESPQQMSQSFTSGRHVSFKGFGSFMTAVNAFQSLKSKSTCVDITDGNSGELLSSFTSRE